MLRLAGWAAAVLLGLGCCGSLLAQSAGALYGPRGVSADAVRQGVLGSCYFHASIASLAQAAPETLREAIRPSALGSYKVHFASGPDEMVLAADVQYGHAHSYDRSEGDWVLVLMRGYAQRAVRRGLAGAIEQSEAIPGYAKPVALEWLNHSGLLLVAYDRAIRSVVSQEGEMDRASLKQALTKQLRSLGVPAAEAGMLVGFMDERGFFIRISRTVEQDGEVFGAYKSLGQGGIPVRVMESFMGTAHAGLVADHDMTMQHLRRLNEGGMAMVAGSWNAGSAQSGEWFVAGHAYSVMGFDEETQTVRMRNPWGGHPGPDGSFALPLGSFLEAFESVSYSGGAE